MNKKDHITHFGLQPVSVAEKASKVAQVFDSVANKYDIMNDVMSLGTHRVMKRIAANSTKARSGHQILDLAGGTGDMAILLSQLVGESGHVCVCDINGSMLLRGRDKLLNRGIVRNVSYVQADGEKLPFPLGSFNAVSIAFGIRNFTKKEVALLEIYKALRPGGKLVILEFSKPQNPIIRKGYNKFSSLWPKFGQLITGDKSSYKYLVESIEVHPNQDELSAMIVDTGFSAVKHMNILNGIAAIHEGIKPRLNHII